MLTNKRKAKLEYIVYHRCLCYNLNLRDLVFDGMRKWRVVFFGKFIWSFTLTLIYNFQNRYRGKKLVPGLLGLNSTIAFRHAYSVESTLAALNLLTVSWSRRTVAMTSTIVSGGVVSTCNPAADKIGAISSGIDHWLAPSRNSSRQPSSRRITWWKKTHFSINFIRNFIDN